MPGRGRGAAPPAAGGPARVRGDRRRQRLHGRHGRGRRPARRHRRHRDQPGYGAAVHAGLLAATSDYVAFMDGDGSFDPAELLPDARRRAQRPRRPGRRPPPPGRPRRLALARPRRQRPDRAGGCAAGSQLPAHDIAPIRICRRDELLALDVRDRRFGYPVELLQKATDAGWRFAERDVTYHPRAEGTRSKVSGSVGVRRARPATSGRCCRDRCVARRPRGRQGPGRRPGRRPASAPRSGWRGRRGGRRRAAGHPGRLPRGLRPGRLPAGPRRATSRTPCAATSSPTRSRAGGSAGSGGAPSPSGSATPTSTPVPGRRSSRSGWTPRR